MPHKVSKMERYMKIARFPHRQDKKIKKNKTNYILSPFYVLYVTIIL